MRQYFQDQSLSIFSQMNPSAFESGLNNLSIRLCFQKINVGIKKQGEHNPPRMVRVLTCYWEHHSFLNDKEQTKLHHIL